MGRRAHPLDAAVLDVLTTRAPEARGTTLLVGVSGGADSLALWHALWHHVAPRLDLRLAAAVFDHGWRPESAAEAAAVADHLRTTYGAPVHIARANPPRLDEAGARDLRHAFLRRCAAACEAPFIALGHTADDRAETLLLNLVRGAGPRGLGAMNYRDGPLLRPLLDCSRAAVRAYATAHGLPLVDDPTNAGANLRARLRHEVLPLLDALRPGARGSLARAAANCAADAEALDTLCAAWLAAHNPPPPPGTFLWALVDAHTLHLPPWLAAAPALRIALLRVWLRAALGPAAEVEAALVERVAAQASEGAAWAPLAWPRTLGARTVLRCGPWLALAAWPRPGEAAPRPLGARVSDLPLTIAADPRDAVIRATLRRADYHLRADQGRAPYQPAGRPRRTVADYWHEQGVPRPLAPALPVVCCGDEVVWVPGQAPAAGWADPRGLPLGVLDSRLSTGSP